MYVRDRNLGNWSNLFSAAVTIGSKLVDKNIQKRNFEIEKQRAAIEEKREQLELTKLANQRKIAELQLMREQNTSSIIPSRVSLPGIGQVSLPILLGTGAILLIFLLRKKR